MFSIYTTGYNLLKMTFDYEGALLNWAVFLGTEPSEIVIAINKSEDGTLAAVRRFCESLRDKNPFARTEYHILDCDVPYSDPEFDGKLKDLALKACREPYCILLDLDERLYPPSYRSWVALVRDLQFNMSFDGYLIPSVNVYKNERSYSSLGQKWYLHRNSPNIGRGVVKWAYREDGSIDITKSDTTELIYRDSRELARIKMVIDPALPDFLKLMQLTNGEIPYVYHLGALDLEQRAKQDAFWQPHWQNRDKTEIKTAKTPEQLAEVQPLKHGLPLWK